MDNFSFDILSEYNKKQGSTIKPLARWLSIKKDVGDERKMCEEINENLFDNVVAGIEEIIGLKRHSIIAKKLNTLDKEILQKIFLIKKPENELTALNHKLFLTDHFAHLYGPTQLKETQRAQIFRLDLAPDDMKQLMHLEKPVCVSDGQNVVLSLPVDTEIKARSASRASETFDITRAESLRPSFRNHPREVFPGSESAEKDLDRLLLHRHVTARRISQMMDSTAFTKHHTTEQHGRRFSMRVCPSETEENPRPDRRFSLAPIAFTRDTEPDNK